MHGWTSDKFHAFYRAFQRRQIYEELLERKVGQINALWSNPNYDSQKEGEEAPRIAAIQAIEDNFDYAVDILYGVRKREDDVDIAANPFLAPATKAGLTDQD